MTAVGGVAVYVTTPAGNKHHGSAESKETSTSPAPTKAKTKTKATPTSVLPPLRPDGTVADGRPPQFVDVSFDGSGNLDLLRHWLQVGQRSHARFSFFLSGVYLLDAAHKDRYVGPHHRPGASAVGFANVPAGMTTQQYMSALTGRLNLARQSGNEVGTHFNGHFCTGVAHPVGTWSSADWKNEIDQFKALAANIAPNNGLSSPVANPLPPGGPIGGRTPCLEGNMAALYPVLVKEGFRYDASRTGVMGQWPVKYLGLWSMTLDGIPLAGTHRHNLSMDYNLYYVYANAKPVAPKQSAQISRRAYQSYVDYFDHSYYGNRAPIDLGNHFEHWDNSAYSDALTRFVETECVKPEVRCVPYRDLVGWLDARSPQQLAAFQAGAFRRLVKSTAHL
ncbi:MAG: hypothetical protein M3Z46_04265 [Actinomycetota bacterium]|nr:hypothetical protein [Actinomycetota bacterium]